MKKGDVVRIIFTPLAEPNEFGETYEMYPEDAMYPSMDSLIQIKRSVERYLDTAYTRATGKVGVEKKKLDELVLFETEKSGW